LVSSCWFASALQLDLNGYAIPCEQAGGNPQRYWESLYGIYGFIVRSWKLQHSLDGEFVQAHSYTASGRECQAGLKGQFVKNVLPPLD
jgi:hypothetical protein